MDALVARLNALVPVETPDGRSGRAVADYLAGNMARAAWDALKTA